MGIYLSTVVSLCKLNAMKIVTSNLLATELFNQSQSLQNMRSCTESVDHVTKISSQWKKYEKPLLENRHRYIEKVDEAENVMA